MQAKRRVRGVRLRHALEAKVVAEVDALETAAVSAVMLALSSITTSCTAANVEPSCLTEVTICSAPDSFRPPVRWRLPRLNSPLMSFAHSRNLSWGLPAESPTWLKLSRIDWRTRADSPALKRSG